MKNLAIIKLRIFGLNVQIAAALSVLALTMLIPFVVHLIPPVNGVLAGKIFLPLYLAPFISLFFFKRHVAYIAGIAAPFLNMVLTGSPAMEMAVALSLEMIVFITIAAFLLKTRSLKWFAAIAGVVLAKVVSALIISFSAQTGVYDLFINFIITALPGIAILALINLIMVRHLNR